MKPGRCPNCGAPATRPDQAFCAFCAAAIVHEGPSAAALPGADARPRELRPAEKLELLERHPSYPDLLSHEPPRPGIGRSLVPLLLFGGVAVFLCATILGSTLFAGPLVLAPLAVLAVFVWVLVRGFRRTLRRNSAPLERVGAVVLGKRVVELRGEEDDTVLRRRHTVEIEEKAGKRRMLSAGTGTARDAVVGDVGVAYVREDTLVEFHRVDP